MTWAGRHYSVPLSFFPLFSPLYAGDRAPLPFPPQEARPYLNKLLRGGEAAHTERHEDPAPSIAALGGVVGELLADLAVDLIPRQAGAWKGDCLRRKATPAPRPNPTSSPACPGGVEWGKAGKAGLASALETGSLGMKHRPDSYPDLRPGPQDPEGGAYPALSTVHSETQVPPPLPLSSPAGWPGQVSLPL